jgi:hypothetical protein
MNTGKVLASGLLAVAVSFPLAANAGPISANTAASTEGLGNFTGSLNYLSTTPTTATLTVELTNTTPSGGGFITGFVLNNPDDTKITGLELTSVSHPFTQLGLSSNGVNGEPFGLFDFGAALGGNFQGGGSPSAGIPVTGTGSFSFSLTGTMLDTLSQASFESAPSVPPGGECCEFFVARFRGITTGEGSDKVPAIPIPAAAWLLGSGLVGLAIVARRKMVAA